MADDNCLEPHWYDGASVSDPLKAFSSWIIFFRFKARKTLFEIGTTNIASGR
jgi:hypothetical protein